MWTYLTENIFAALTEKVSDWAIFSKFQIFDLVMIFSLKNTFFGKKKFQTTTPLS